MKRTIAVCLALIMMIGLLPMSVSAAGTAEISFTTTFEDGMTVGDTFTVTASLANNPGVASVMLTLDWNSDAVQFTGFDKYEDDFPVSEVLEARGWTAVANHTLGTITASRTADNTSNGTLFTANFKIVGSGDLNISLLDSETETTFMMNNATYEELDVTIDYSALEGLTVAGGDEGAAIPEGAPFTAITTDAGAVSAITDKGTVTYTGYSSYENVPYYHVEIPEGATEIYVTHPTAEDPMIYQDYTTGNDVAAGYYADTASWSGNGLSFAYEAVDGGYIITIPTVGEMDSDWDGIPDTEIAFVADADGNLQNAAAVERNNYTPICFFTFEYAVEEVDDSFQMVTSDGKDVVVTYVGEEPNYGMGSLYKVEVPLGTTQVNVTYNEGIVKDNGFGFASTHMIGFAGVSDDGYGMSNSNGKTTVALSMVKAPANMAPELMKLLNVPYGENPRMVGIYKNDETVDYFAFTYILEEGQHFAALPEGTGYTASGSPIASDGYTFKVALLEGYEATADFAIKVNGETVATVPGDVTVASVTEDLIITVEGVAKIVEATDISVTLDLTGYTGTFDGYLGYVDRNYNSDEVDLQVGKSNTLALKAADNGGFYAQAYEISPLVTGWMINDTAYYYPNEYATYSLADGVQMSMNTDGYFSVDITSTNPYIAVIKPIVATPESVGAAPDFAEDCIDVTDISVLGADVIRSAWDGDTLNVVLAADTATDATIKTLWTIYVNNSNEGAGNAMFNINGTLQTPSPVQTYMWGDSLALEAGIATKTFAFEMANTPWDPNSALTFTNKTFTLNFSIAGSEPEQPATTGYTYATSADVSAENGGNATVSVKVTGNSTETVTAYNSYDVTLTFDNTKLEYVGYDGAVKADGGEVKVEGNTIRIVGCGEAKEFGTDLATLTFKTLGEGTADVTVTKAQVSDKEEAVKEDAPEATAQHADGDTAADTTPSQTVILVPYSVTKPGFVSGNDKILHGEDYTFSYTDTTNYTYSDLTVTVGGVPVTPTEANGVYTIENVTGAIVITATQTPNSYDVTKPGNVTGPDKATYGEDYIFTVTPIEEDMAIDTVKVTLADGTEIPYTINGNGEYVIAGTDIAGAFEITVTEKEKMTTVTFSGIEETEIEGGKLTMTAEIGKDFTFTLIKKEGYDYTVKIGEDELDESTENEGEYTIPAEQVVKEGVQVDITKEDNTKPVVDVAEYINLDGKTMFLVTAKWGDRVLAYGEDTMFWSDKYTVTGEEEAGAYCWLVLSTDEMNTIELVKAAAEAAIVEAAEGATATAISYDYDVNGTTKVDVNDAQLAYDMYNASYMEFNDTLPMLKFLEADMVIDGKLDTKDVAAIISYIVSGANA